MARGEGRADEMVVELGRKTEGKENATTPPGPDSKVPMGFIPQWVIRECRADSWLYAAMSSVAQDGTVRAPVAQLAQLCGVSPRTVQNALASLKKAGALVAEPQHDNGTGSRLPNLYHLCVEEPPSVKVDGSTAA